MTEVAPNALSVPCAGPVACASVRSSPSASVQVSGIVTAVPARAVREASSQLGGREIETSTVAGGESAVPSPALKVNESAPYSPPAGV